MKGGRLNIVAGGAALVKASCDEIRFRQWSTIVDRSFLPSDTSFTSDAILFPMRKTYFHLQPYYFLIGDFLRRGIR